jgi:hypothetical protein
MPQIPGWPYNSQSPKPAGLLRRIWPALRTAAAAQFAVVLVGGELLEAARLVNHAHAGAAMFASLGVAGVFALAEAALRRLRLVDDEKPVQPAIDVAAIPPPPVPPPVSDAAPRPPANTVPTSQSGGALPARFGGVTWGLEGGYVWRPPGREEG